MQTSRETAVALCGTQEPIVRLDQLTVGSILTGIAVQYAWQIHAIRDGELWMKRLPNTEICRDGLHAFATVGRGQACSRCQLRRQKMEEFLPRAENKPRAYVIAPREGAIQQPQPFTLYGALSTPRAGQPITLKTAWLQGGATPTWNETLPLIPALHVLWTVPQQLRELVNNAPPVDEPVDD